MKRVAFVINTIVRGGPSNVVLNLIKAIDFEKYTPILITLFNGNDSKVVSSLRSDGIQVIECTHNSRAKYLLGGRKEFTEIIKREHIDIIHSHGFIPDIITAKVIFHGKKITTIHNVMFEDYKYEYGIVKGKIFTVVHLYALRKLDIIVGCSYTVYKKIKQMIPDCKYVRNGITNTDMMNIISRKEIGIQDNSVVFIYVGKISLRKNVVGLIEGFKKYHLSNEYLLMLGDGADIEECKTVSDNHIIFLGFQDRPLDYMNIADIYISASRSEGFSISLLEALSCGLGMFLSDIPSHREIFEISEDIYLGEYFSESDFGKKLEILRKNWLKIDKGRIVDFQRHKLSAKVMWEKYEKFYEEEV